MADDSTPYHKADGTTVSLDTADAVDASLSDLSARVLGLETKPDTNTGLATGDLEYRLHRLETVLVEYFFSQFQRYDADHPKPTPEGTGNAG
jgi:hypothetical protein